MNIQTNKLAASALCTLGHAGLWRGCGGGLTALSTYLNHDSPSGTQQHRLPAPNQTSRHPRGPLTLRQVTVKRKNAVIRVRFRFVHASISLRFREIRSSQASSRAQPSYFFGSSDGARSPAAGTPGEMPCRRPPRRHAHLRQAQITPTWAVVVAFLQRVGITGSANRNQAAELRSGRHMMAFDWSNEARQPAVDASAFQGWNCTIAASALLNKSAITHLVTHTDRTGHTLAETICFIDLCTRPGMRSLVPGRPDISDEVTIFIRLLMRREAAGLMLDLFYALFDLFLIIAGHSKITVKCAHENHLPY